MSVRPGSLSPISEAFAAALASSRSVRTTAAPCVASASAIAEPNPPPAPVTNAFRPSSENIPIPMIPSSVLLRKRGETRSRLPPRSISQDVAPVTSAIRHPSRRRNRPGRAGSCAPSPQHDRSIHDDMHDSRRISPRLFVGRAVIHGFRLEANDVGRPPSPQLPPARELELARPARPSCVEPPPRSERAADRAHSGPAPARTCRKDEGAGLPAPGIPSESDHRPFMRERAAHVIFIHSVPDHDRPGVGFDDPPRRLRSGQIP